MWKRGFHIVYFILILSLSCFACLSQFQLEKLRYSYFETPDPDDPWSSKIADWQQREFESISTNGDAKVSARPDGTTTTENPDLQKGYALYRAENRRSIAREFTEWIQQQTRIYYTDDGPRDHWPTLEEVFITNSDDCDGLELLTYYFLRDIGFSENEIFRAIVYRQSDGQHHMVTMWFEERDDPWVIDPTGAMISGMSHMSEITGWVPIKVFDENEQFSVRRLQHK